MPLPMGPSMRGAMPASIRMGVGTAASTLASTQGVAAAPARFAQPVPTKKTSATTKARAHRAKYASRPVAMTYNVVS